MGNFLPRNGDIPHGVGHGEEEPGIVDKQFSSRCLIGAYTVKIPLKRERIGDKRARRDQSLGPGIRACSGSKWMSEATNQKRSAYLQAKLLYAIFLQIK